MKWPLLKVLLLYSAGVLLGRFVPGWPFLLLGCSMALLLLALAWGRYRAVLLHALAVLCGYTSTTLSTAVLSPHDLRSLIGTEPTLTVVRGRLQETPALRVFELGPTPAWRTLARVEVSEIRLGKNAWQPAFGRVAVATPGLLTNLYGRQVVEISGVVALPKRAVAEGTFDYRSFLEQQGIYYRLQADLEADWKILSSPKKAPLADRFREWGQRTLAQGLPGEDESLRLEWALTLGWKTALTEEASEPFIQAATYHIFAVDGLRMAIIFGILFGLLRACGVPRAVSGLALLPFLWFYVALTGWPASAIRAMVMLNVIIVGWTLKRPSNTINSLLTAALIILVWDPQQLFQAGFQLSFLVVLCLILLMTPMRRWVHGWFAPDPLLPVSLRRRWPGVIRVPAEYCGDLLLTSFVAWIGSIPLVAYYFNIVTPVSTPANIVAVPLCALVLMSNLASLLLAPWFTAAAELFNHAGWFLMECIRVSSCWFADWPKAWFYAPAPGLFASTLYYAILLGLATGWLLKPAFRTWKLSATLAAALVWCGTLLPERLTTRLTVLPANGGIVSWFDAPGARSDLLIDTGNTNGVQLITKPFLRAQGVNSIATLLLTHGDLHHVGGVERTSELFRVRRVCASPLKFRSAAYRRIVKRLGEQPNLLETITPGNSLGPWHVLHPEAQDRYAKADDGAVVLRAEIGGTRILLLSDLGRAGQDKLLERVPDLQADVVVTGLPSGGEPLCDSLLKAIRPRFIVVADSEFPVSERAGQPLRQRLSHQPIPVLYTRETGAVTLELAAHRWSLRTMSGTHLTSQQPILLPKTEPHDLEEPVVEATEEE
jgi:competence protein ComEC